MSIGGNFSASGSDGLLSALSVLADPAKFQSKLDQLSQAERNATEAMKALRIGEDVVAELAKAKKAADEADRMRNEAQVALNLAALEAAKKVADAEARAQQAIAEAIQYGVESREEAESVRAAASQLKAEAEDAMAKATSRTVELDAREAALNELTEDQKRFAQALEAEKAELNKTRQELERVFANLRS